MNLLFLPEKIFFFVEKHDKKKRFAILNFVKLPNFNVNNGYMHVLNKIRKLFVFIEELKMKESFFKIPTNQQTVLYMIDVFKKISFLSYLSNFIKTIFLKDLK